MSLRERFVKSELEKIYQQSSVAYDYALYSQLEDDKIFFKIFELLFEINEKANLLRQIVKGSWLIL